MALRKGQMFIVTMVFLIALIFSVQQLLYHYTVIDLSIPSRTTDAYLLDNMESSFQAALDSSDDCLEARKNVKEVKDMIASTSDPPVDITGELFCPGGAWPPSGPDLTMQAAITGETYDTSALFEFYRTP